jgi:hypothetical protein
MIIHTMIAESPKNIYHFDFRAEKIVEEGGEFIHIKIVCRETEKIVASIYEEIKEPRAKEFLDSWGIDSNILTTL